MTKNYSDDYNNGQNRTTSEAGGGYGSEYTSNNTTSRNSYGMDANDLQDRNY